MMLSNGNKEYQEYQGNHNTFYSKSWRSCLCCRLSESAKNYMIILLLSSERCSSAANWGILCWRNDWVRFSKTTLIMMMMILIVLLIFIVTSKRWQKSISISLLQTFAHRSLNFLIILRISCTGFENKGSKKICFFCRYQNT